MNKIVKSFTVLAILALAVSCNKNDDGGIPPELPPYESIKFDFNNMSPSNKITSDKNALLSSINLASAGITVAVWNLMLTATLKVPVVAFYYSFVNTPAYLGDEKWQWNYDVDGLASTYNARLTCEIRTNDVKWEMYLAKTGEGGHDEFLWFEGTSNHDGNSGQWVLNHSHEVQEAVLQIDWEKTGEEIGAITYTYVRASNNGAPNQLVQDSYLSFGLTDNDYNAFYNIHFAERDEIDNGFKDVNIEWNTTVYNGRIKAEHYFRDNNWHCWDGTGQDADCN